MSAFIIEIQLLGICAHIERAFGIDMLALYPPEGAGMVTHFSCGLMRVHCKRRAIQSMATMLKALSKYRYIDTAHYADIAPRRMPQGDWTSFQGRRETPTIGPVVNPPQELSALANLVSPQRSSASLTDGSRGPHIFDCGAFKVRSLTGEPVDTKVYATFAALCTAIRNDESHIGRRKIVGAMTLNTHGPSYE
jgi:hypothetical protein